MRTVLTRPLFGAILLSIMAAAPLYAEAQANGSFCAAIESCEMGGEKAFTPESPDKQHPRQFAAGQSQSTYLPPTGQIAAVLKPWSVELRLKNYFSSHTSYEFGNPFEPYQSPLSRLEFPINSWWAGVRVKRDFSRFSVDIEMLRNISENVDGAFKDSDWDDNEQPSVKTIYSESRCRMESSHDIRGSIDLKISDWIGLPYWLDLRPLVGLRWQRFSLTSYNGMQYYPAPLDNRPPEALPGDGIRFQQTYWHHFLGMRAALDLKALIPWKNPQLLIQLDWAHVQADNEDRHLLRVGNRITYERTRGDAWHASIGLKAGLTESLSALIEADYLRILTRKSHRLVNDLLKIDFSFEHGVVVWSEQAGLMIGIEYVF